ncbi:MAG: RNase adapter RapZ [Desulfobacterales bacterium]|nr:MAG: RNase adapter RapZ [Desulfobacterales bacterium]UCD89745.1 MAG: RNase adapter RapZ [Desulfobacterales bacterium]
MKKHRIIIITGLSGSGKSTAIDAFEDAGFYCVDNMPVQLLPKFLNLPIESKSRIIGLAFVMDLREKGFLTQYTSIFESLKKKGYHFNILFLEAEEETLLQRYSQTRRQHPLSHGKGLLEGIRIEKEQLKSLKTAADKIIDTSRYSAHDLKAVIHDIAQKAKYHAPMGITVMSFGFKFGIPYNADLIADVRFLVNPYFVPELKDLTGIDEKVKDFVLNNDVTRFFLEKYLDLLDYLIPLYEKEGKAYLTVAVGCTGGRHRSVAIAQSIFEHIKKPKDQIILTHRDIDL